MFHKDEFQAILAKEDWHPSGWFLSMYKNFCIQNYQCNVKMPEKDGIPVTDQPKSNTSQKTEEKNTVDVLSTTEK